MPHIVIAGAGPIGLYTAITLKRRGFDVTVIDAHVNNYDRPGVIAVAALDALRQTLPELEVSECGSVPPAIYIRDLQKALRNIATGMNVNLRDENFIAITGDGVIMFDSDEGSPELSGPCHLLIDCTGETRAVMSFAEVSTIVIKENPIPNHFIAYIDMDEMNDASMHRERTVEPTEMAVFRHKTGWKEFVEPTIDKRRWDKARHPSGEGKEAGYCLYFEVPQGIAAGSEAVQENYLQELLKLKKGTDIQFRISRDRGAFIAFDVCPKKLDKKLITSSGLLVAAVGDALISAEYRLGIGIANGVAWANGLARSLEPTGEGVGVNEEAWNAAIAPRMGRYETEVQDEYSSKERKLYDAAIKTYHDYSEGYEIGKLDNVKLALANDYKLLADKFFECAQKKDNPRPLSRMEDLIKAETMYRRSYNITRNDAARAQLIALAGIFKSAGDTWPGKKSTEERKECCKHYERALSLITTCDPNSSRGVELQCKIHSNLAKIYFKNGDYEKMLLHFDRSLDLAIRNNLQVMLPSLAKSLFETLEKLPSEADDVKHTVRSFLKNPRTHREDERLLHTYLDEIGQAKFKEFDEGLTHTLSAADMRHKSQGEHALKKDEKTSHAPE